MTKELIIEKFSKSSIDNYKSFEPHLVFYFWEVDNLISINNDYNEDEYMPEYFGMGYDSGDEMLTVELLSGMDFITPFFSTDLKEKVFVVNSLEDLIE